MAMVMTSLILVALHSMIPQGVVPFCLVLFHGCASDKWHPQLALNVLPQQLQLSRRFGTE